MAQSIGNLSTSSTDTEPEESGSRKPSFLQRVKRRLSISYTLEKILVKSRMIDNVDLAKLLSKSISIGVWLFIGVTIMGTMGVDTKPLLAGLGVAGFTIGFALKEIAANMLSGILLAFEKPFEKGNWLKIHGTGGGIEGVVQSIDFRCVVLQTEESRRVLIPSVMVYSNPITVFRSIEDKNEMNTKMKKN